MIIQTDARYAELLVLCQARFEANRHRHPEAVWADVAARLLARPEKLAALAFMEETGGEPDVVEAQGDPYIFYDCSAQSPEGRRSLCYDEAALAARKKDRPAGSAIGMAEAAGIALLDEAQYRRLQSLGEFDTKTSSWVAAPPDIRRLGGALFGDRRYGRVFVYHNGAESYYAGRGFRGSLTV